MTWESIDPDWGPNLQRDIEKTMERLEIAVEEGDGPESTPSGQPYCGCSTCGLREVLTIAVDRIANAVRDGELVEV